ncbi:MAG: ABC transporter ATP-binding protein [Candidatus Krumholzibacteriota bacterium]|nr:ABC transporter ATP-binding protein [Candidatus Krumholzibacteriota bacterium]
MNILRVKDITKTFRGNFIFKKSKVLHGISFSAREGEILGFLGPNGAGKTTTIKIILGLIKPDSGSVSVLGRSITDTHTKRVIGFLPENPFFYPHLTLEEFLKFCGKMSGIGGEELNNSITNVISRVGLAGDGKKRLSGFSKGMLQRAGLAQAVIHDPDLLILDEPFSGLDPLGRKMTRDFLLELKKKGKTIFFSSHILSDMETLCDRVCIIREGKIVKDVGLDELFEIGKGKVEITAKAFPHGGEQIVAQYTDSVNRVGDKVFLVVKKQEYTRSVLQYLLNKGSEIIKVASVKYSLEDMFVKEITGMNKEIKSTGNSDKARVESSI